MSLPRRTEILIVGAGPTGLAAALSLHKQGCTDLVIVDETLAEAHTSRAITMHAATLAAMDEIGCADEIVAAGIKATGFKIWDGLGFHPLADFDVLAGHTKYPFLSLLPQFATERVLAKQVAEQGIDVLRPVKAVGLKVNSEDSEFTDVSFEDGRIIQARYVIGADGAKSSIREAAGITYKDPDGEDTENSELRQAVVADVIFENEPPAAPTDCLFVISAENIFLCLPLPPSAYEGQQVWRIAIGIPIGVPPHAPDTAFLQGVVDAFGPAIIPSSSLPPTFKGPLKIAKTIWSSRFRTDSAIASAHFTRLRTDAGGEGGVVLLIGDAAHKQSPAGGQGMNLGLRDAVFLGPALAAHITLRTQSSGSPREAIDEPLKRWADNRHEQALKVIRFTKALLKSIGWKNEITWYYGVLPVNLVKLRHWILWLGDITGYMKKTTAWNLSGLLNP
ncbi:FAD/NAD(P)-binding domain-containing protein [Cytidiella melzeri]|nr:FAD/NAD(P)-binding domain-containing protein [Cytidiella melzeri]